MDVIDFFRVGNIVNTRFTFQAPLDHFSSHSPTITIAATLTQKYDHSLHSDFQKNSSQVVLPEKPKLVTYIQGGPGFPCQAPLANSGYTKFLTDKDYQILFLDQRGTGLSTPIEAQTLGAFVPRQKDDSDEEYTQKQLQYILHFRADSIVEDLELARKHLIKDGKISLLGQSYGGFTSFTYLSKYPDSLREVMVTGGVPPINFGPDDVYTATYARTTERNVHYYKKYPNDVSRVKQILSYLSENTVTLPSGGRLSVERFQQLGLNFGAHGGTDSVHQLVFKLAYDLKLLGKPSYQVLTAFEASLSFDTNVIYALFQEAIYMDGNNKNLTSSNWSAGRLRYTAENTNFVFSDAVMHTDDPVYFTGEMVYQSMYDDYAELRPLKDLAHALHRNTKWSPLYDTEKLAAISWEKVPIVAATYVYDQYVDFDVTNKVKKAVFKDNGNLKQYITSEFFHNGVRAGTDKVLGSLFDLFRCEID